MKSYTIFLTQALLMIFASCTLSHKSKIYDFDSLPLLKFEPKGNIALNESYHNSITDTARRINSFKNMKSGKYDISKFAYLGFENLCFISLGLMNYVLSNSDCTKTDMLDRICYSENLGGLFSKKETILILARFSRCAYKCGSITYEQSKSPLILSGMTVEANLRFLSSGVSSIDHDQGKKIIDKVGIIQNAIGDQIRRLCIDIEIPFQNYKEIYEYEIYLLNNQVAFLKNQITRITQKLTSANQDLKEALDEKKSQKEKINSQTEELRDLNQKITNLILLIQRINQKYSNKK